MRISAPIILGAVLALSGCYKGQPDNANTKNNMSDERKSEILRSNKIVCINGSLYFASLFDGHVVISTPVIDDEMRTGHAACVGGLSLDQFDKLQ